VIVIAALYGVLPIVECREWDKFLNGASFVNLPVLKSANSVEEVTSLISS